jgi:hypothetical protein
MAPICPDLMMLFTASGRTPAARATSPTLKTSGTDVLAVDIDSVGCGAISLPDWFCAGERAPVCFSAVIVVCCCGSAARAVLNQRQPAKTGTHHMPGCQGCQGARVPGVPGCQGARGPRCQGARVPRAHVRRAHVPRARLSRATCHTCHGATRATVPTCHGAHVPRCRCATVPMLRGAHVARALQRATCHVPRATRRSTSQNLVEQNLVAPRRTS